MKDRDSTPLVSVELPETGWTVLPERLRQVVPTATSVSGPPRNACDHRSVALGHSVWSECTSRCWPAASW